MKDLSVPTAAEFADTQLKDPDLVHMRKFISEKKLPTSEEIAGFSARLKEFVHIANQLQISQRVPILTRVEDPERKLIIVPAELVEHIIRVLYKEVGATHQAAKASAAKVIQLFFWPGLKRDGRLFVECCSTFEEFLQLALTPNAGLRSMNVGGRGDPGDGHSGKW